MKQFKQIIALLQMSLSGILQRKLASLVVVIGIACVVAVLISMLSMGAGVRILTTQNVRSDRAVVLGKVGYSVSDLDKSEVTAIMAAPGIKRDGGGRVLATVDSFVYVNARKKGSRIRGNAVLHGVNPQHYKVFPEIQIVAGRTFQPGLREVIVGRSRHEQYENFEIGDKVRLQGGDWTVVGHFTLNGGLLEDSLYCDADTLASAVGSSSVNAVVVVLDSPANYDQFKAVLEANPSIAVEVKHEAEFMAWIAKTIAGVTDFISYFVGTVMAIGASLGALNVMYSVIDGRRREIATLCAIGFSGGPIVVSVLLESLLLALPGALLGALVAWISFSGNLVNPYGTSIKLAVTPELVALGILWALVIGLIGGFLPALRAARVPIATALRTT